MNRDLIEFVKRRAESTCEYCRLPQKYDPLTFEVDHVIATIHGGTDAAGNLALSCFPCNRHKGPNLTGIDPITRKTVKLFHPRRHSWSRHFAWDGPLLIGRTAWSHDDSRAANQRVSPGLPAPRIDGGTSVPSVNS